MSADSQGRVVAEALREELSGEQAPTIVCARLAAGLSRLPGCGSSTRSFSNQVRVRFDYDATTDRVVAAVQESGEAWMGGTVWDDRRAIRISVSSWQTNPEDVERTTSAFAAAARQTRTA